jgi:hypothetical protein
MSEYSGLGDFSRLWSVGANAQLAPGHAPADSPMPPKDGPATRAKTTGYASDSAAYTLHNGAAGDTTVESSGDGGHVNGADMPMPLAATPAKKKKKTKKNSPNRGPGNESDSPITILRRPSPIAKPVSKPRPGRRGSDPTTHRLHPLSDPFATLDVLNQLRVGQSKKGQTIGKSLRGTPKFQRNLLFRSELVNHFAAERDSICRLVHLPNHPASPASLHVFVDWSNIWIGFMETTKELHGIDLTFKLPEENRRVDFESFAFLLERGRAVEKRILVGSGSKAPVFDMIESFGYETNILAKVKKVPNSRKPENDRPQKSESNPQRIHGNTVSAALGPAAPSSMSNLSPEKWVEQGVDELLQMKMMESVLDSAKPAVMVVATGDGAIAEYSDGFQKAIERALKRGWTVELVSWRRGLSRAYLDPAWLGQWSRGQFKMIALDSWFHFLVDS